LWAATLDENMGTMCLGIPGRVLELRSDRPDLARVDVDGVVRYVNLGLLEDDPAQPGEWVLIHLGFALQKMTEQEVDEARSTLAILGDGGLDENPFAGLFETPPVPTSTASDRHEPLR
jgi:hydrogenase expression/formation protein HypC